MARLSDSEVRHYAERGYLIPSFRLPKPTVDRMRDSLDRLIADNPDVRPEKLISAHVVGQGQAANPEGVRGSKDFLDLAMEPDILGQT